MVRDAEAAVVLARAAVFDARLRAGSVEDGKMVARAWAAALAPSMTVGFALEAVVAHYKARTDVLMPAHLNQMWSRENAPRVIPVQGVPMPDWFKAQARDAGLMRG